MSRSVRVFASGLAAGLLATVPFAASAHQIATYRIGDDTYRFVVGSQNEPVAVDDKTGVELAVSLVGHDSRAESGHHVESGAVAGLENALKVELIAGPAKRTLELRPMYGEPGSYYAPFYPTVATAYSYRFFGDIGGVPVDLTFTCRAEGEEGANEGEKRISEEVLQLSKTGGFGCPSDKEPLGFPEPSASIADTAGTAGQARGLALAALALAVIASGVAFSRRR